jgi:ribosomal protein L37E
MTQQITLCKDCGTQPSYDYAVDYCNDCLEAMEVGTD